LRELLKQKAAELEVMPDHVHPFIETDPR
jgi:REP element-mobilizing transposase RayT